MITNLEKRATLDSDLNCLNKKYRIYKPNFIPLRALWGVREDFFRREFFIKKSRMSKFYYFSFGFLPRRSARWKSR